MVPKLEKADKKDTEDQRVFELLEEAALDSSFCSTSVCLWSFNLSADLLTTLCASKKIVQFVQLILNENTFIFLELPIYRKK